jgi:methionine-rich copper-binding protein CopC
MRHHHVIAAGLAATAALLLAGAASAHAHLVKSTPAANATVAAPKAISLTFNEKLIPAFSKFELVMPSMNNAAVAVKTAVSKNGLTITGEPQAPLMPGFYKINWHAASSDGHKMDGVVDFTVK